MGAGMTLLAVSLLLFGTLDASSSFWNILPGAARRRRRDGDRRWRRRPPRRWARCRSTKAGVGSAVINSMRQVGGSLGIAIMGALVATRVSVAPTNPLYGSQFVAGYHRARSRRRRVRPASARSSRSPRSASCDPSTKAPPSLQSAPRIVPEMRKTPGCGSGGRFLSGDSAFSGGLPGTWLCGPATPLAGSTW